MKPISERVCTAMQGALRFERTAFSQFHDQEHYEQYHEHCKLQKWYDGLVHDSRCRRRKLLDRLFATGQVPGPEMAEAQPAAEDEADGIEQTRDLLMLLHQVYLNLYRVAGEEGDATACKIATRAVQQVECTICECDARLRKYGRMGPAIFAASVAQ